MRTLVVLTLLVAAEGKDDKAELKKFEGAWQLVSPSPRPLPPRERGRGEGEQPADYVKRIRWIFDDKGH